MFFLSPSDLQRFDCCAMRKFKPGERHVTRRVPFSVLIMMLSGVLRFREDGVDVELTAGEYYIQRQGLLQEGVVPSDEPEYFFIHFDGVFSEDAGLSLRGSFSAAELLPYLKALEQRWALQNAASFASTGGFYEILGKLEGARASSHADTAQQIAEYIYRHYAECGFGTRRVKAHFSYTDDYIIKIFKKKFAVTPYQYMLQLRLERAKQLMLSTQRSLTEICTECGYENYSSFYRSFFGATGKSPRDWLRSHIE